MESLPVVSAAMQQRLQVAAIDFGTTYSGYAFSFRADFEKDPLKIIASQWKTGTGRTASLKTPSCVLFKPNEEFHSFGFEAEDQYADLAADGQHSDWFYFKRFKMLLYENKKLNWQTQLTDDKGLKMPAMKVFSECIRFLKEHLMATLSNKNILIKTEEVHWVLTVPAIWDDAAKQFMREAAIHAGIATDNLSLALEPEAASLFCKYLPVNKIDGADGGTIACFSPETKYLVLDAGGGTVDITVHETQSDCTVREVYKANGGPWGGTNIDGAFLEFLSDITGKDTMQEIIKSHKDDYLDLFREFEIKKNLLTPELDQKVQFRLPLSIHDVYREMHHQDFRRSLMMKQDLKDQITFTGDKLRVKPEQVKRLFTETCDQIVAHLDKIFTKSAVKGTDTVVMVGGFSESKMLQHAVRSKFPLKTVLVPEDAGLAVLKGAVIFGHNPKVIASRISRFTYGIKMNTSFVKGKHDESRMVTIDGETLCEDCFDKHVKIGQHVEVGMTFDEQVYRPVVKTSQGVSVKIYKSVKRSPLYVDEDDCSFVGKLDVDLSGIASYDDKAVAVKMMYGSTELGVEVKVVKTGKKLAAAFNFLGDSQK